MRPRCCGCCLAVTATRMPRFSPSATSSRCCNASSTGNESGSTPPTGPGWPRCYTGCPGAGAPCRHGAGRRPRPSRRQRVCWSPERVPRRCSSGVVPRPPVPPAIGGGPASWSGSRNAFAPAGRYPLRLPARWCNW